MTTYNSLVSAGNVDLNAEVLDEIFQAAAEQSVVFSLARRLRNMTTKELKLRVNTELPVAYFVGEQGLTQTFPADALKQSTKMVWSGASMYAGEIAAYVTIPNSVLDDADFDVVGQLQSLLPTAIAQKVDAAVLYGTPATDVPDDWTSGIFVALPAENKITLGSLGDIYNDILAASGVYAQVEYDGFDVNGVVGDVSLKAQLRGLRDATTGVPIFVQTVQERPTYTLAGVPMLFPRNGAFDIAKTLLIAGDWNQLVYSIRQDVAVDKFTTGIIQDGSGTILYNLLQQDLTAFRITFRMGWALPQPAQWAAAVGTRYPFAALVP